MKAKLLPVIALFLAAAATVIAWQQWRAATERNARVAVLAAELKDKADALAQQESLTSRFQRENETYKMESELLREKLRKSTTTPATTAPAPTASPTPDTTGLESINELIRRTRNDPLTRERTRRMLMSSLKQTYGAFVRENQLTSDRAERFFDLLLEQAMVDWDDAANFFAGDKDDPSGEEARAAAAAWAESERQLQQFLSKDECATYQEYDKRISERTALEQIRRELAFNSKPLSDDQANFLFQVLRDERLKSPPVAFDPRSAGRTRDTYRVALEGDNGVRYLETQADINQRVLARAEAVLSAEQYEALATFQRQHLEQERKGIEYARKVMAQKKGN